MLLIFYVFSKIDISEIFDLISQIELRYLFAAIALQWLLSFLQAYRWQTILRSTSQPILFRDSWVNVLLGLSFNQILPSSVGGDAVRLYYCRDLGLGLGFASILADRVYALVTLILVCCVVIVFIWTPMQSGEPYQFFSVIFGFIMLSLTIGWISVKLSLFQKVGNCLPALFVEKLKDSLQILNTKFETFAVACGLSMAIHFGVFLSAILIYVGLGGESNQLYVGSIFLVVILLAAIPVSFGGWGLREGAAIYLYSAHIISSEMAVAVSIYFGITMAIVGALGGAVWLVWGGQVRSSSRTIHN
jgi:uncharacterized protein (TIRG00374 family)